MEGLDRMIEPADYASLGLPLPARSDQMGELFLTAKDGYAFAGGIGTDVVTDASEGGLGSHGYPATDSELSAIFIASGRGIKPGVALDSVNTVDLAPTVAQLLGVELKDSDGTVLTAILSEK
jgi:hypothetical protein